MSARGGCQGLRRTGEVPCAAKKKQEVLDNRLGALVFNMACYIKVELV